MPMERWGTLSVKDHLDTQAMVADLLLYDRLVFPVFSGEGERTRWRNEGWGPEEQESLIQDLGADVAVCASWGKYAREQYNELRKLRRQVAEESSEAYQVTRMLLTSDPKLVPRTTEVRAVAAYRDEDEGRKDLGLTRVQPDEVALGKLAFVIGQELLVPLIDAKANPLDRDLLLRVRDLSLDGRYRDQRQAFYQWQETTVDAIARGRQTVTGAVKELKGEADALNQSVTDYFFAHRWELAAKTALTVVGVSLPFMLHTNEAAGLLGLVPPAFEVVKCGAEVVAPMLAGEGKCEAAAMIVSARRALG
jgi:hypothetical protein